MPIYKVINPIYDGANIHILTNVAPNAPPMKYHHFTPPPLLSLSVSVSNENENVITHNRNKMTEARIEAKNAAKNGLFK